MKASFDAEAIYYDAKFTRTNIGKAQRNMVYFHIKKYLNKPLRILEINCGTGEDAIWFAKQNHLVTATDISEKMIEQAKSKGEYENLTFLQIDCLKIHQNFNEKEFNFLFSNFGGLNCLNANQQQTFFENIGSVLEQNSKLALVIMPKNTLWEQFYFSVKGKFSEVFRRKKESAMVNVATESIPTFYYNPKDIVTLAKSNFKCIEYKPIGFFIPPSYLEPFVRKHELVFRILKKLDNWIKNLSFFSKYADHYIIVLEKK